MLRFPDGSDIKESACSAGDPGLIPGPGRSLKKETTCVITDILLCVTEVIKEVVNSENTNKLKKVSGKLLVEGVTSTGVFKAN